MKIFLQLLKRKQYNISAYGASGKGQALMQFCNINHKLIDYVYDRSKFKQGKFTSGTHIKIIDPKFINKHKKKKTVILYPDVALMVKYFFSSSYTNAVAFSTPFITLVFSRIEFNRSFDFNSPLMDWTMILIFSKRFDVLMVVWPAQQNVFTVSIYTSKFSQEISQIGSNSEVIPFSRIYCYSQDVSL